MLSAYAIIKLPLGQFCGSLAPSTTTDARAVSCSTNHNSFHHLFNYGICQGIRTCKTSMYSTGSASLPLKDHHSSNSKSILLKSSHREARNLNLTERQLQANFPAAVSVARMAKGWQNPLLSLSLSDRLAPQESDGAVSAVDDLYLYYKCKYDRCVRVLTKLLSEETYSLATLKKLDKTGGSF
ncbi:hypothetical protein CPB84DRAFT_1779945 [Gymnopilus junonius]|uniref:Uncharacterized protein n=1 Tax=Gymnopilus junonius TaxID=109634 RepID=A0A9P5NNW7_GYMJU|nr:hypothetical protein CPB84DRAFT_1779945 [Gymnopilus junonius]